MPRRRLVWISTAALVVAAAFGWAFAHEGEPGGMLTGKVPLKSAGALAFSPEGVLFVGDSESAAVFALDLHAEVSPPAAPFARLESLDEKIAALLGVSAREVVIQDLAVHPQTRQVVLSLMRGRGEGARPVLLRISPDGKIDELGLEGQRFSRLDLTNAPAPDAQRHNRRLRDLAITDLELIDGELYIAGLSNEEFASVLRRAPYPFRGEAAATGLEIYHGAHGRWETAAPVLTFLPYSIGSERHVLASYLCTPLVTFPLAELKSRPRLKGKTLAELGWGNRPIDMLAFEREGERYLLISNTHRGVMKLRAADIEAAQKKEGITAPADVGTGVSFRNSPLGAVVQMADLDAEHVLLLTRSLDSGALTLGPREKEAL